MVLVKGGNVKSMNELIKEYAASKRTQILTNSANGVDDDLPEDQRPTRDEVSPGCLLDPLDEIELYSGITAIYLCPGRGVGWLYAITLDSGVLPVEQYEVQYVTDRIPVNEGEEPMPIFPPEAPPPPPPPPTRDD